MNLRRRLIAAAGAGIAAVSWTTVAKAHAYPSKTLRFVMPCPPGGNSGILARPIVVEMGKNFGQSVFIDLKADGGTTLGADIVAKSAPDGHTLKPGPAGPGCLHPSDAGAR